MEVRHRCIDTYLKKIKINDLIGNIVEIKSTSIPLYYSSKNKAVRHTFEEKINYHIECPFKVHDDVEFQMICGGWRWYCHECGYSIRPYKLLAKLMNISTVQAIHKIINTKKLKIPKDRDDCINNSCMNSFNIDEDYNNNHSHINYKRVYCEKSDYECGCGWTEWPCIETIKEKGKKELYKLKYTLFNFQHADSNFYTKINAIWNFGSFLSDVNKDKFFGELHELQRYRKSINFKYGNAKTYTNSDIDNERVIPIMEIIINSIEKDQL